MRQVGNHRVEFITDSLKTDITHMFIDDLYVGEATTLWIVNPEHVKWIDEVYSKMSKQEKMTFPIEDCPQRSLFNGWQAKPVLASASRMALNDRRSIPDLESLVEYMLEMNSSAKIKGNHSSYNTSTFIK